MENKVLVLAFGAFEGRPRNASYDLAVRAFGDANVTQVDVDEAGFRRALDKVERFEGNVLWLGESDGAGDQLVLETRGRNLFLGRAIREGGPPELLFRRRHHFSECPVVFSRDAGDHFCNRALYEMLRVVGGDRVCVFVHVPRFGRASEADLVCVRDKLIGMQ